jgi:hypothetical protein
MPRKKKPELTFQQHIADFPDTFVERCQPSKPVTDRRSGH